MTVPVQAVGAVIVDSQGRLLMIRRGRDPGRGLWSLPGGRVEPGESLADALVREVHEETGLVVEAGPLVGTVDRPPYEIHDVRASVVGGTEQCGDDAIEMQWVAPGDLEALATVPLLREFLKEHRVIP